MIPSSNQLRTTFDLEPVPIRPQSQQAPPQMDLNQNSISNVFGMCGTPDQGIPAPVAASPKRKLEEPVSPEKRQRLASKDDMADEDAANRFRPYQAEQWTEKFQELLDFKKERGHCCVPHTFDENPSLARWVKRQRYQYKLKQENKPSTMTDERVAALEQVGFVWDSHGAAWMERWNELCTFVQVYGHANVPSNHPKHPQLATWVKCQRRQYKLFWEGKPSNMTLERLRRLESVGFEWELRVSSKNKSKNTVPLF